MSVEEVVPEMSAMEVEAQKKDMAAKLAANDLRYKELQAKNEKTKADIKKRDEMRKLKQDKQMEESQLMASIIIAQKKKQLEYCSALNQGPLSKSVRRVNHFKRRPHSTRKPTISPKRVPAQNDQFSSSTAVNLDLRVGGKSRTKKESFHMI